MKDAKSRKLAVGRSTSINVKSYGAAGNGTTDDTAAINAAIAAWKATIYTSPTGYLTLPSTLYFPKGTYKTTSGLDFTGIRAEGGTIICDGAVIDAHMASGVAIDFLGSRSLKVYNLHLEQTVQSTRPDVGMQIGRNDIPVCDQHLFVGLTIRGYFTRTALYNFASETCTFDHPYIQNLAVGGSGYALIQDGLNHWGVTSAFIAVTAAVDTVASFNENTFIGATIISSAPNSAIWMGCTSRHRFIASWATVAGGGASGVGTGLTLWSSGSYPTTDLYLDLHFEDYNRMAYAITLDGPASSTPNIYGLTWIENNSQAYTACFTRTGNVTGNAILQGFNARMGYPHTAGTPMFDDPTKYRTTGTYSGHPSGIDMNQTLGTQFWGTVERGQNDVRMAPTSLLLTGGKVAMANYTVAVSGTGLGTGPTVSNNGTAAMDITVGTSPAAASFTVTFGTAATNGWVVTGSDITTQSATVYMLKQIGGTATTAVMAIYDAAGAIAAPIAGDHLRLMALAY